MIRLHITFSFLIITLYNGCEPFAKSYQDISSPKMYQADHIDSHGSIPDEIKVVTWNIRFGAGRLPWIIDSCGEKALAE